MSQPAVTPDRTDTSTTELTSLARNALSATGPLAAMAASERARLLSAIADALEEERETLVRTADTESALGEQRLNGELTRTTGQLEMFADYLDEGSYVDAIIDTSKPGATPPRPDLRRMQHPIGPIAVYAASNFPFAFSIAGGDTASALAAGCPVIVKEHPGHPVLSQQVAEVVSAALVVGGAPPGAFATVRGLAAGVELIKAAEIRAGAFTGSLSGGRALYDLAAARPDPIPFFGELGSLNPVVVTRAAASERAEEVAAGLAGSFSMGIGQFCTKPGLVLVPSGTDLERQVANAAADASGGRMLTPAIAERFHERLDQLRATEGVEQLAGPDGREPESGTAQPVVLTTSAPVLRESVEELTAECFGPLTLLVRYDDEEELVAAIRNLPGSLTASVLATDDDAAWIGPIMDDLRERAGRIVWNGWPTGVAVTWAMHHGGPWPATTASGHTSVGVTAIRRFLRPTAYQDLPDALLPPTLRDDNPLGILRRVDGVPTTDPVGTPA